MQKIIEYLNNNPTYVIVFAATLLACVAAVVVICLFYKHAKNKDELAVADAAQSDFSDLQEKDESDNLPEMQYTSLTVLQDNTEDETFDPSQVLNDSKEQLTEDDFALNANTHSTDSEDKNNVLSNDTSENTQDNRHELNTRYSGKWLIIQEDNRYSALLKASNGETMLSTESYTSISGIKSGIDTLKKNIEKENYAINLDKNGNFVFKIFSTSNRLLCIGEGYSTREQCEKAFQSVKRFSKTAIIVKPENTTDNK